MREGRVALLGREQIFGGEWVVRSAGLTHFRRSHSRVRVLFIRLPCPRREIKAMGPKDAPCEHPSPAKTSAPAPSAFIFPPRRSHFPRMAFGLPSNDVRPCRAVVRASPAWPSAAPPQSNRHPAAAVIHNGLSTEKLSTSLLAALCKTFSPSRLRTRIYNISFARRLLPGVSAPLWGRGHAVVTPCPAPPSAGWGRAKAKVDAPSRNAPHFPYLRPVLARLRPSPRPLMGEVPCVLPASARLRPSPCRLCAESLCAMAECTRQSPPLPVRSPRPCPPKTSPLPPTAESLCAKAEVHKANPAPAVRSPRPCPPTAAPPLAYGRSAVRKGGSVQGNPRPCPCVLPASARLRPRPRRLRPRPLAQQPAPACLRPRPRRLNGHPASAGGRENDRMAHRRTAPPTHRTPRGNDTCTIRVPRRKGAQSVVHNLYFSSSRPASFCTTFPQSCTDRPATYRKEHKWPLEGLIFRVLPPDFPTFCPKAIVQNIPAPAPFSPRKTPRFAPTRNRARTLASAGRDNTPRPAHSSRFQRDTNKAAAHEMPIFAPPKAENGGVFGLKC